jgi:hypothetical protein
MISRVDRIGDEAGLVAAECHCGTLLVSTTEPGLASQLGVHWRREDWGINLATPNDITVASRWLRTHAFRLTAAELED